MTHIRAEQAPGAINQALERVSREDERIIIIREGSPVAALIPYSDFQWLEKLEERLDAQEAAGILEEIKAGRMEAIPLEEVEKRLDELNG